MRRKIVSTDNVNRLNTAYQSLRNSTSNVPKFALCHGFAGAGKTTATNWLSLRNSGVYLRASTVWTPSVMLRTLVREVGKDASGRNHDMLEAVIQSLSITQKPLFIDEVDMILECNQPRRLFETVRELHDQAGIPVILVGMETIKRKINRWPQLNRRISEEIEFFPLNLADTRKIATDVCEVEVADDLLEELHRKAGGNCGYITNGLEKIESLGRSVQASVVTLKQWNQADKTFFLDRR